MKSPPSITLLAIALMSVISLTSGKGADQQQLDVPAPTQIDCFTRLPSGRLKQEAETASMPPIGFTIGDVRYGRVKYVPGKPFPIMISYYGGQVLSFFLKAETLFGSSPVGEWTIVSGEAVPSTCVNSGDAVVSTSLGKSGVIELQWTSPADQTSYVEFQVTVVGADGKFWLWNSFLCESQ